MQYSYKNSLGLLSRTIAKDLGKKLELKAKANGFTITAAQWSVISMLQHEKSSTQKEISQVFGYDKVMVLRIIKKLEDNGWVKQQICQNDKRSRIVQLTETGKKLYEKILPVAQETLNAAYHSLTAQEVNFYLEISEKIRKNLK